MLIVGKLRIFFKENRKRQGRDNFSRQLQDGFKAARQAMLGCVFQHRQRNRGQGLTDA